METEIGKVPYYPKISVAAVILKDHIAKGDRIYIRGPYDDIHQSVTSIEIEHLPRGSRAGTGHRHQSN